METVLFDPACRRPLPAVRAAALLAVAFFAGGFVRGETIHVYLIGGQSNADGRANISGATQNLPTVLANPQPDVPVYYGTSASDPTSSYPFLNSGTFTVLQPGLTRDHPNKLGPELSFGRSMADYHAAQGESIALIKYAVGGSSLAVDWKAGGDETTSGDGGSYLNFQTIVTKGLAALQAQNPDATLTISGMIWMQGETDASQSRSGNYGANLESFIADVRATYGADLPFVIGQLSTGQTAIDATYLNVVREAQSAVAAADPLNALVVTDGFGMDADRLHFNRPGQVALGYAFADGMQTLVAVPEPRGASLLLFAILALSGGIFAKRCIAGRPRAVARIRVPRSRA